MNRWQAAAMVFSIGLGGSFAAVTASSSGSGRANGDLLGVPTLREYCKRAHDDDRAVAILRGSDAYGWACATRTSGLFATYPVDMDEACRLEYGSPSYANAWDSEWPESWECFHGVRP